MQEESQIRYVVVDAQGKSTFVYGPNQQRDVDDGTGLPRLLEDGWTPVSKMPLIDENPDETFSIILLEKAG